MPVPCLLRRLCLACSLSLCAAVADAGSLHVVTEELPPYNMTENGQVTGLCTEIVQATLKEAGLEGYFEMLPWARAYDLAQHVDNVLIYSMSRTPERERMFQWVGNLVSVQWYLYAHADRPVTLRNLADARAHQVATVNQDSGEQFLQANGFVVGQNLQSSARYALDYEKLKRGHVDLWISDELNAYSIVRQAGDDPKQVLTPALEIPDLGQDAFSLAASPGTPAQTVEKLRQALERLHQNGTYDAIVKKWF